MKDEDVARLSPLKERHIDFLGRYLFDIKSSPAPAARPGHRRGRRRRAAVRPTRGSVNGRAATGSFLIVRSR
ncbi:hypothetical protein [Actinomadura sp. CNU-125]|uniref:hypothetical protein n=1 Tax=Actinomadura sp. CNU-125 TaxID=1904961 RepID=UPI0039677524